MYKNNNLCDICKELDAENTLRASLNCTWPISNKTNLKSGNYYYASSIFSTVITEDAQKCIFYKINKTDFKCSEIIRKNQQSELKNG